MQIENVRIFSAVASVIFGEQRHDNMKTVQKRDKNVKQLYYLLCCISSKIREI